MEQEKGRILAKAKKDSALIAESIKEDSISEESQNDYNRDTDYKKHSRGGTSEKDDELGEPKRYSGGLAESKKDSGIAESIVDQDSLEARKESFSPDIKIKSPESIQVNINPSKL